MTGRLRSDRHAALDLAFPPDRPSWLAPSSCNRNCNQGRACDCAPNVEEDMQTIHAQITLPGDGRHPARTYSTEAEAFRTAYYAAAIEKPAPSRTASRIFGALLAAIVVATLYVLAFYGGVKP